MRAGTTKRQGPVLVPLDLVQRVQHAVACLDRHLVGLPVGLGIHFGVISPDLQAGGPDLAGVRGRSGRLLLQ